ncbi:TIGR02588 family protein [Rhizobium leguminosarum]|uniref:TIGR02588 family protein n=1 Tax=Rhizobium leguminosarum TaxID=384 RepID=UPI001C972C53|nr:TIGR02588 family protein [Rhizobium leguminosarum]MBY5580871.1 TIGR02588 family protein [Rhizobium leguminosarum]MBY5587104.1 TIGR02588 family protein [Rhizobium leguminosarum]MBY5601996.1 TIGR02588 family protein [Rhizobium leguminosarum]MBY5650184.1 TIGR02588 family protein [Rhizobium leguminosarum]
MTKTSNDKHVEVGEPHWIEWATGVVSAVIVLCVIAWIGKDALVNRDTSPNLVGVVLQTEKRGGGFQVLFEIRNDSSATASQVTVQGEIREQGSVLENVETVLDYVPGHSKAKGGLIFQQDPAGKTLTVRASSFDEP